MGSVAAAHDGHGTLAAAGVVTRDLLDRHQKTSDMFWRAVMLFGALFILGGVSSLKADAGRPRIARTRTCYHFSLASAVPPATLDLEQRTWICIFCYYIFLKIYF